jgi:hypothetical protein
MKQPDKQGHNRVDCLKIEKRHKWVTYLIKQQELTITDTYNKDRLRRIKNGNGYFVLLAVCSAICSAKFGFFLPQAEH